MRNLTHVLLPLFVVLLVAVVERRVVAQEPGLESSECPITQPTENSWFANENLKVAVPGDAPIVFEPGGSGFVDHDGSLGIKWAWERLKPGKLLIGGRRLDGDAAPARAYISDGYGLVGFQPVYLVSDAGVLGDHWLGGWLNSDICAQSRTNRGRTCVALEPRRNARSWLARHF
jgi:hypothetical protein